MIQNCIKSKGFIWNCQVSQNFSIKEGTIRLKGIDQYCASWRTSNRRKRTIICTLPTRLRRLYTVYCFPQNLYTLTVYIEIKNFSSFKENKTDTKSNLYGFCFISQHFCVLKGD